MCQHIEATMDKDQLRKDIRQRKRQFTGAQLDELSFRVIERILKHPRVIKAHTLMLYYSLPDEVDTHRLVTILASEGKRVLLPKVIDGENMELREYHSESDMCIGSYGIMEPIGKPFTDYSSVEVALVPGMAFDAEGNRLGRGKGYYDHFLPHLTHAYTIGICFDFQKTDHVPINEHDRKMDQVI